MFEKIYKDFYVHVPIILQLVSKYLYTQTNLQTPLSWSYVHLFL